VEGPADRSRKPRLARPRWWLDGLTGAVRGIERLDADEQLIAGDGGKLVFVNQLDGTQGELKVA
jgi:hypothetical protein